MSGVLHWLTSPAWAGVVKALLHTFWQGAAMAALLALALRRESRPAVRYGFSLAALAVTMTSGLVTWAVINGPGADKPERSPAPAPASSEFSAPASVSVAERAVITVGMRVANSNAQAASPSWTAWLALAWLGGAGLMLARAGTQVAGAEKLRRSCQPAADPRLTDFLSEARRAMRLGRQVRLAVTDRLTSPAVVGVLVPTLVLPLSLLTTLTPEQIRFVLLHELAHVRRGDYLANLFQLFAEALLFFNPAVWWISHQIRREREACCDALAIELSGAPAEYARTLLHIAENILSPLPAAAAGFGERRPRSTLTDRVQRLLVPGYRPALRLTWRAMLCSLVVGTALLMLSAVGTRITVAAILSPQQRIEQIERKMAEYGQEPEVYDSRADSTNAPKVQISGQVRTADGSPLPNVRWVSLYTHRKTSSGVSGTRLETNGTFSASLSRGQICVGLDFPGFAPCVTEPVDAIGTNRLENIVLVLDRGFDTSIVISDSETAAPIPNAKVFAQYWLRTMGMGVGSAQQLSSDQSGKATLTHSPTTVALSLVVNAPGYEILEQRVQQLNPQEPVQIKLRRGLAIPGVVLNRDDNAPIAGATIQMIHEKGRHEGHYEWTDAAHLLGTTDAAGKFTLNQLLPGSTYWLGISSPGHESVVVSRVPPGTDELTVKLGPELVVHGRVLGPIENLRQISRDRVLYRTFTEKIDNDEHGSGDWVPVQVTNGTATFTFTNRVAGSVTVTGGGYSETRDVAAPIADWVVDLNRLGERSNSVAESARKREVVFRFVHASGVPPRGTVRVSVSEGTDPDRLTFHDQELEITNGEVRAQIPVGRFAGLSPKQTIGYWFNQISRIAITNGAGPMIFDVPLVPAGAIYATARNVDGTPAGGLFFYVVEVKRSASRPDASLLDIGPDGFSGNSPRKWVSGALPLGGTYQILGWRDNSFCAGYPIELTGEKPTAEIELQFKRGRIIEGVVTDGDGKPIADTEVECSFTFKRDRGFGLKPVFTDKSGRFQIEDAAPELGTYYATVKSPGYQVERIELDASKRTAIRLKTGLKLSGRVVEADTGYAIPNAEIHAWTIRGEGRWPQQQTKTDEDGRFEFDTLADTIYTLDMGVANFAETRHRTEFRAGQAGPLKLAVTLNPGSSLHPKVPPAPSLTNQNSGSRSAPNAQVFIQAENGWVDLGTGLATFNSNVVIRSGDQVLKADAAVFDTRAQKIVSQKGQAELEPKRNNPPLPSVRFATNSISSASQDYSDQAEMARSIARLSLMTNRLAMTAPPDTAPPAPITIAKDIQERYRRVCVLLDTYEKEEIRLQHDFLPDSQMLRGIHETIVNNKALKAELETQYPALTESRSAEERYRRVCVLLDTYEKEEIRLQHDFLPDSQMLRGIHETIVNIKALKAELETQYPALTESRVAESTNRGQSEFSPEVSNGEVAAITTAPLDMQLRRYDLNPSVFLGQLRSFTNLPSAPKGSVLQQAVLGFFASRQINLDPSTGRNAFFNPANGNLLVRATTNELEAVEHLLFAPQVHVLTRFAEIPEASARELRASLFGGNNSTGVLSAVLSPLQSSELRAELKDAHWLIDQGEVITTSGGKAQVQVVDVQSIVFAGTNGGIETKMVPLGPVIDLTPTFTSDKEIQMTVTASWTEFLGYDDPGQFIIQSTGNVTKGSPLPHFRLRSSTVNTNVPDGHTLVISGLAATDLQRVKDKVPILGSLPMLGRFFRTESNVASTNALVVLVTPTLMDQSGNRLTSK